MMDVIIERQAVVSSNVVSVGYDDATAVLEVEFAPGKNGAPKIYRYQPVDRRTYAQIASGTISVGRLMNDVKALVASGQVKCTRVEVAA